ncbi:MAG: PhzF family phenazine biosynthesis protein, partial [bacterium]|nr:PhzF family phenazine biosynthesis protein [bacterium]
VGGGARYDLRWFTPEVEIDLCGHATLASAYVIFQYVNTSLKRVEFDTMSGPLMVVKGANNRLEMDFPSRKALQSSPSEALTLALGDEPIELYKSRDFLAVFETEDQIVALKPNMDKLGKLSRLETFGVIVTAPGKSVDFVSRFFAPGAGIPEDPVTGSAHSTLIPYWAERLGKKRLNALQLSERGGELFCEDRGDRVLISGFAVTYSEGFIHI